MLSNAYLLAKIRFDTAENEPAKNLQNFRKNFEKTARVPAAPWPSSGRGGGRRPRAGRARGRGRAAGGQLGTFSR